jgi:hypothetical protein
VVAVRLRLLLRLLLALRRAVAGGGCMYQHNITGGLIPIDSAGLS